MNLLRFSYLWWRKKWELLYFGKKGRSPSLLLVAEYGKTPFLPRVSGICCVDVICWVCGTDQNVFVMFCLCHGWRAAYIPFLMRCFILQTCDARVRKGIKRWRLWWSLCVGHRTRPRMVNYRTVTEHVSTSVVVHLLSEWRDWPCHTLQQSSNASVCSPSTYHFIFLLFGKLNAVHF